ncbi:MAG TPA: hypothetical protein VFJ90_08640, partial [Candidatus Didemnitutus sp.]|nr:hypothetical protein [Candidatus Didemnitutus sp.]
RLLHRLPLPLLAYDGFAEPASDENAIYAHAPMRFILRVPVGQYGFSTKFGYNPAALNQREGHSDGMEVRIVLETAAGEHTLLRRSLDPARAEDQPLQQANLALDCPESGQLQLIVAPGPSGIINWDWAMWTDMQVTPAAKH